MSSTEYDEILRSTARLARLSFAAAAASVFLVDEENGTLVFEASSGVGEDRLVGTSIPAGHGIAGWVAAIGETMIVRGVADDERFDRAFAEGTGLVPDTLMAVPMEHDGEIIGGLEVLDPKIEGTGDLEAIELLTELANQSTAALRLVTAHRRTHGTGPDAADPRARLAAAVDRLPAHRRAAADRLVLALADLLDTDR
jgi:GAF domain-containing protein